MATENGDSNPDVNSGAGTPDASSPLEQTHDIEEGSVLRPTEEEDRPESPPVLCALERRTGKRGWKPVRMQKGGTIYGGMAFHFKLLCAFMDEPCVVLLEGCNARNIVQVLVHESIHHALFWMEGYLNEDDQFDNICFSLTDQMKLGI